MQDQAFQHHEAAFTSIDPAVRPTALRPVLRPFEGIEVTLEWSGSFSALIHALQLAAAPGVFRLDALESDGVPMWPNRTAKADPGPIWRASFGIKHRLVTVEQAVPHLLGSLDPRMRWTAVQKRLRATPVQ